MAGVKMNIKFKLYCSRFNRAMIQSLKILNQIKHANK